MSHAPEFGVERQPQPIAQLDRQLEGGGSTQMTYTRKMVAIVYVRVFAILILVSESLFKTLTASGKKSKIQVFYTYDTHGEITHTFCIIVGNLYASSSSFQHGWSIVYLNVGHSDPDGSTKGRVPRALIVRSARHVKIDPFVADVSEHNAHYRMLGHRVYISFLRVFGMPGSVRVRVGIDSRMRQIL